MSTRQQGSKEARARQDATRARSRVHGAAGVLLRATLWIPPLLLGAMLVAGPVSASIGWPAASGAPHHRVAPAAGPHGASVTSCAATIQPLPAVATGGPAGAPQGAGTCLEPAPPSATPAAAASIASGAQVVTQSMGMEVRPG